MAVAPQQRPQASGLHVPQPRDRKPRPLRPKVFPTRRTAFDDRQVPISDIHLNPDLVPELFRNPATTPPRHPRHINLRKNTHPTSLPAIPLRRSLESASRKPAETGPNQVTTLTQPSSGRLTRGWAPPNGPTNPWPKSNSPSGNSRARRCIAWPDPDSRNMRAMGTRRQQRC